MDDYGYDCYRRFLQGEDSGMVEIIRYYKDGLILFLTAFTQNIQTAEELTEDTFVRLVVKRPHFSGKCSFKTWLYTIGRNVAIDELRRRARIAPQPLEEFSHLAKEEDGLEHAYLREERKIILHKAMRRLNPEYQQVLYLSYFEDLNHDQISQVMKKTKRQIENLTYRAKHALRTELEKEGFHYEDL